MSVSLQMKNGGLNHSSNGEITSSDDDGSLHGERAIDVPSNFKPQPKEKPRLHNSLTKEDKNDKIKKYQTEIKARKEQEARVQREQDFLRASLRESKKLQNLEKKSGESSGSSNQRVDGFLNKAFDRDAEEEAKANGAIGHSLPNNKAKSLEETKVDVGDRVNMKQILNILNALRSKLGTSSSELRVMNQLFNNVQFQDAVSLYNQVINENQDRRPTSYYTDKLSPQVITALQNPSTPDAKKLKEILIQPPFKGVLIDEEDLPASPTSSNSSKQFSAVENSKVEQYAGETVKVISIQKTADPLGATVKNEGESIVIGRIVKGGVADKSNLLHEGDELLEVNGMPMRGKTINEVSDLLGGMTGELQFVIVPGERHRPDAAPGAEQMVSVRALFSYDSEEDQFIPCEELGVSFQTGDILHIINQDDPNWWQAYREGEEDQTLAGLVPSKSFWETREQLRLKILADSKEAESQTLCCSGRKKRKKMPFNPEEIDTDDILTYEEVEKYYPQPNRKRPVVLIGPPDVGRKELRQRLLESDAERFAAPIPHTSRPRREDEEDGRDYYFTARHIFEADIRANKFVEHGHFQKDYYGTSLESIRNVVNSGKICILNLHPQALKMLRSSDVKPYIIFIAPPGLEKLRANLRRTLEKDVSAEHCEEIIDKGREMENKYGHYFDFIIPNNDIDTAFNDLLQEINRLEVEPQWVPSEWLK